MSVRKLVFVVCDLCQRPAVNDEDPVDARDTIAVRLARARAVKAGYTQAIRDRHTVDLCPDCARQPPGRNATIGHVDQERQHAPRSALK